MSNDLNKKLDFLNKAENMDFNLYVGFDEFVDYVELGRTSKERLKILIMCYVNNPTIEEINNWTLEEFLNYVKDTDDIEFYEQDMVVIRKCIDLIEGI